MLLRLFALLDVVRINHITSVAWMWFKSGSRFCLAEFYMSFTLILLPCLTVLSEWMSLSLPYDSFLERYIGLFPLLGLAVPLWSPGLLRPSSAALPFLLLNPWASPNPPQSSVISTPSPLSQPGRIRPGFSSYNERKTQMTLFLFPIPPAFPQRALRLILASSHPSVKIHYSPLVTV